MTKDEQIAARELAMQAGRVVARRWFKNLHRVERLAEEIAAEIIAAAPNARREDDVELTQVGEWP